MDRPAAAAWSGGKDCCLAVHRAREAGLRITHLLTVTTPDGQRSRSNGVAIDVLGSQAAAMEAELVTVAADWERYEAAFVGALERVRGAGVETVVFGDIAGDAHRAWDERVCAMAGLRALLPLWGERSADVVAAIRAVGIRARVTAVRAGLLDPSWLSRQVAGPLLRELHHRGCDPCGELGEYHTVATHAPFFSTFLRLRFGAISMHGGYWHRDARIAGRSTRNGARNDGAPKPDAPVS